MKKRSARYSTAVKSFDRMKSYTLEEAVDILKGFPAKGSDETVEIAVNLGVDPRHSEQMVRGSLSLPHGTGRSARVIAFAEGADADAAREAGAAEVGVEDLIAKIEGGWLEFDVAVAHPSVMSKVGKLGRVLGPKGLMPSPKSGTVTPDVSAAVAEFKAGKIEFRVDSFGIVHAPMGKISFDKEQLVQNLTALVERLRASRPSSVKGTYLQKVTVSTTFGPGVKVNVS